MTVEGMGPSLAVEGATDREVFEAYVEKILAPSLQAEQVVVMDNLSAHKGERVRELVEGRGAQLAYLPPYSPGLNLSKKPSPRSRVSCAKPRLGPARLC
jgi:transposase